jgi:hypothetical protein
MRGITRDYAESANHLPADPLAITIGTSAISRLPTMVNPFRAEGIRLHFTW